MNRIHVYRDMRISNIVGGFSGRALCRGTAKDTDKTEGNDLGQAKYMKEILIMLLSLKNMVRNMRYDFRKKDTFGEFSRSIRGAEGIV